MISYLWELGLSAGGIVAVGAGLMLTPFGAPIVSFFLDTKIGRYIIAGLVAAWAILLAVFKIYAAGKAAEHQAEIQQNAKAVESHKQVEQSVAQKSDDEVTKELKQWSR
jgi:hypothetical protein